MKKITLFLILALVLSGCATYKFQKSSASQGYLVTYDGYPIPEYTFGSQKEYPELGLAKERFGRRRAVVERYYKKMDRIQSRFRQYFWETPGMFLSFIGGVLRWPFIAAADYKYNHNPQYRERVDRLDEEKEALENARVEALKKELDAYVAMDLVEEAKSPKPVPALTPAELPEPAKTEQPAQADLSATSRKEAAAQPAKMETGEEKPAAPSLPEVRQEQPGPVARIIAKPLKGYSPLKVKFSARKSYSPSSKIVAYSWDFGDGDTSEKKDTENTFWSTTLGSRTFNVTLTVKDRTGATASATAVVEVITP